MRESLSLSLSALREAFLSVLPYTILISFLLLVSQLFHLMNINFIIDSGLLLSFFPFVIFVSVVYHFSNRHYVNFTLSFLLSLAIVLTIESLFFTMDDKNLFSHSSTLLMMLTPISTILSLKFSKNAPMSKENIEKILSKN